MKQCNLSNNQVANGRYVQAENGGGGRLLAISTTVDKFETFTLT